MVKVSATYMGEKHCQALHEPSQSIIETDAPKDNQGRGEKFSPTDLIATSLATCILTTVAIVGEKEGINLKNSTISVEKEMSTDPRRIKSLQTIFNLPRSVPAEFRKKLEFAAANCPVKKSIHPDINTAIQFLYDV